MDIIRKYALINAVEYQGKATAKAVMGKVMGESPDLRKDPGKTLELIEKEILKINKMTRDEQIRELEDVYPEYFEKEKGNKGDGKNGDENIPEQSHYRAEECGDH